MCWITYILSVINGNKLVSRQKQCSHDIGNCRGRSDVAEADKDRTGYVTGPLKAENGTCQFVSVI